VLLAGSFCWWGSIWAQSPLDAGRSASRLAPSGASGRQWLPVCGPRDRRWVLAHPSKRPRKRGACMSMGVGHDPSRCGVGGIACGGCDQRAFVGSGPVPTTSNMRAHSRKGDPGLSVRPRAVGLRWRNRMSQLSSCARLNPRHCPTVAELRFGGVFASPVQFWVPMPSGRIAHRLGHGRRRISLDTALSGPGAARRRTAA
jgi:hypothetical protein